MEKNLKAKRLNVIWKMQILYCFLSYLKFLLIEIFVLAIKINQSLYLC